MKLANYGIIPPKQFQHKPEIRDEAGYTVAILLAEYSIIPP